MGMVDGFREWVNKNSAVATTGAVVLCVVALVVVITQSSGGMAGVDTGQQAYFYDVETKKIFTAPAMQDPPITSPDGNEAVKVHMFSCGGCAEEERFVGYYEKYTDEAKQAMNKKLTPEQVDQMEDSSEAIRQGHLISLDGENWEAGEFSAGLQQQIAEQNCDDPQQLRSCSPSR